MLWWNSVRKNKEAVITSNGSLTFRIPSGIIITSVYPYRCISALPAPTVVPALLDVTYDLCQASIPLCAALVAAHIHTDGCPMASGTAHGPCWIPGHFHTRLWGMFRRPAELWGWESIDCNWVLLYLTTHLADQCAQNLYMPKHIPLGEFSPQALCADMNIVTVHLKTAINRSLSGSYKVHWVLGTFKASSLSKSRKTNGISNFHHTEITSVSTWKSWIFLMP